MQLTVGEIAQICHAANQAYCWTTLGEYQPDWEDAPDKRTQSTINSVMALMGYLSKQADPSPSSVHQMMVEVWKDAGWKYGAAWNPDTKEHPHMVSWEDLPDAQKGKGILFLAVVKACVDMGAARV